MRVLHDSATDVHDASVANHQTGLSEVIITVRVAQARELGLKPRERGAADADGEDKNKQEREREVRVVREEAERQLEKAKAEIYALQVIKCSRGAAFCTATCFILVAVRARFCAPSSCLFFA